MSKKTKKIKHQVVVLKNGNNLVAAGIFNDVLKSPKDPVQSETLQNAMKGMFGVDSLSWETMTKNDYDRSFPIMARLIAESYDFDFIKEWYALFVK